MRAAWRERACRRCLWALLRQSRSPGALEGALRHRRKFATAQRSLPQKGTAELQAALGDPPAVPPTASPALAQVLFFLLATKAKTRARRATADAKQKWPSRAGCCMSRPLSFHSSAFGTPRNGSWPLNQAHSQEQKAPLPDCQRHPNALSPGPLRSCLKGFLLISTLPDFSLSSLTAGSGSGAFSAEAPDPSSSAFLDDSSSVFSPGSGAGTGCSGAEGWETQSKGRHAGGEPSRKGVPRAGARSCSRPARSVSSHSPHPGLAAHRQGCPTAPLCSSERSGLKGQPRLQSSTRIPGRKAP